MITKFKIYENIINTGIFSVDNTVYNLKYSEEFPVNVYLYIGDKLYTEISIITSESEKLDNNEFFMKSDINNNIIQTLINEGFIEETYKKTKAGLDIVKSYKILF